MSALTTATTKDGMRIYKNTSSVDVPDIDLTTLLFGMFLFTQFLPGNPLIYNTRF
jgi:hypothetical protein